MNTLNDQANAEDFDVLRKAVIRKCYNACLKVADDMVGARGCSASVGALRCADAILEAFGLTEKDL